MARRRRWREVQNSRVAERERQRRWRAAQRASKGSKNGETERVTAACHAPASDAKYADLQDKVRESVDRAIDLSRAALHRLVRRILDDLARSAATSGTEVRP